MTHVPRENKLFLVRYVNYSKGYRFYDRVLQTVTIADIVMEKQNNIEWKMRMTTQETNADKQEVGEEESRNSLETSSSD